MNCSVAGEVLSGLKFPRVEAGLVDDCERDRRATVSGKRGADEGGGDGGRL